MQTKYKLPTLNWVALKPAQVRGTVFCELDDDRLHKHIDFADFEERFKIAGATQVTQCNGSTGRDDGDGLHTFPSKRFKKPDSVSLLEHTRLRNIAISRRRLDMSADAVCSAVNALDLQQLPLDSVELLQRMIPTEAETKAYRDYVAEKKNIQQLTDEDRFLLQLTRVERLSAKLQVIICLNIVP